MLPSRTRALCLTPLPCLHAHITYQPSSSSMLLLPGTCTNTIVVLACSTSPTPCLRSCGCVLTRHTFRSNPTQVLYALYAWLISPHSSTSLLLPDTLLPCAPACWPSYSPPYVQHCSRSSSPFYSISLLARDATALDDSFIAPYRRCSSADALSLSSTCSSACVVSLREVHA
jgi:hypothetical protein